jgi:hypothetical protein
MDFTIDVKIPGDVFKRFQERVENFPDKLAAELVTWQVIDMRRMYPNVERPDQFTAETEIWARSRQNKKYKPHGARGRPTGRNRPRRARPPHKGRPTKSTRPILRASLLEQLKQRVAVLIQELTFAK